jgi:transketolase
VPALKLGGNSVETNKYRKKDLSEQKDPRKTFGEALVEVGNEIPEVLAISADSSSGSGMTAFQKQFPDRHIEFGIMEQGVLGYSAGLATTGKIPFVVAIAPFVTARPFEMFRNDIGYMNQNVKVVGRSSGLTYSQLGPTHHSIDDIAIIRTMPGVTIINPGDPTTIVKAVHASARHVGPVYIKIGSPKMPVIYENDVPFEVGKGIVLNEGKDVCIIGTGTILFKALEAAEILEKSGVSVRLIDMHTIKPLDNALILKAAREIGKIVTVEEHFKAGGLGGAVAELCAENHPVAMKIIGVDDKYASSGPYEELLGLCGLQSAQIADTVGKFLAS